MKSLFLLMLAAALFAGSAAAQQTGAPDQQPQAQQPQTQNVPITPGSGERTRNPQRGEDVGQQGKGVPVAVPAQSEENAFPANMPILATLSKSIEAKKAKEGDQVTAKVEQDVLYQGVVLLPRGSRLYGHVTAAKPRSKGEASEVAIAWDKAVLKSGKDVPVHAIIQAIAPPPQMSSAEAPAMGGAENAGMSGAPSGGAPSGGYPGSGRPGMGEPAGSQPGGQPAGEPGNPGGVSNSTQTSTSRGGLTGPMLSSASRGVQGMPGLTLSAGANAAQGSLITSQRDNVKLNSGTQLLLQVVAQ